MCRCEIWHQTKKNGPTPPNPPNATPLSPQSAFYPSVRLSLIFSLTFSFSFVPAGLRFLVGVWRTLAHTSSTSTTWHSFLIISYYYYYYPGGFFFFSFFFFFLLSFHLDYLMASGLNPVRGAKIRRPASQVGKGQKDHFRLF